MEYIVIKCGGSAFQKLPECFYKTIVNIQQTGKWKPIIVHGGGPLINELLCRLQIETTFVQGLRVTTDKVLEVVEMVLSGQVNKEMVQKLTKAGGKTLGLSGIDGQLLLTKRMANESLGLVGEVVNVNTKLIKSILDLQMIPVISPIGIDCDGQKYNINGDMAAAAIARAFQAKLCFVSDVPGIYTEENGELNIYNNLSINEIEQLIKDEIITGGMIPKVQSAIDCLNHGVKEVVILSGLETNALLRHLTGEKIGSSIINNYEVQHV